MKRIKEFADGSWRQIYFPVFLSLLAIVSGGCFVKKTVKVPVAPHVMAAKSATLEQLLSSLAESGQKTQSLAAPSIKASYTSGKVDSGKLQAYHSAPGYLLLRRPDKIRLNIQNPISKTSLLELASSGDKFAAWVPRDNKFYIGSNSAREFDLEGNPGFSARPIHIYNAVVPQAGLMMDPETLVSFEEDRDDKTKYYILSFYKEAGGHRLRTVRRLWIDRYDLAVSRQQVYDDGGKLESIITYSNRSPVEGILMPFNIHIDRPEDGYSLELQILSWRINPDLPDDAFELKAPESAQVVNLKEKVRVNR
jgi:outer membrane lipoprotein-sorting protein